MKPIQKPKTFTMKEVYDSYADKLLNNNPSWWAKYSKSLKVRKCFIYALEDGKPVLKMSWPLWKEIVSGYYHRAKAAIIQGETLKLGSGLGNIKAIRVERTFANKMIDWGSTFKLNSRNEDGHLKKVYYTDDDYVRIKWQKFRMITNETNYKFMPAEKNMTTGKGFKAELVEAIKNDPLLKFKYQFTNAKPHKPDPCNTPTAAYEA